jgi:cytochrome P450
MAEPAARDFDHHDPGFVAEPWAVYAELRNTTRVARSERYGGFWLITRFDDVRAAANDWQTFTSSVPNVTSIPSSHHRAEPDLPIELDPPLHTRFRRLIGPAFSPRAVDELRPAVRKIAGDLLEAVVESGGGDLVSGFAIPLSVGTLAAFMDLPLQDRMRWVGWVRRMYDPRDPADAHGATGEYYAYIDDLIERRRGSLVRRLLESEVDGVRLTPSEVARFLRVLLIAGHETTAAALSTTLHHLATHPADLERLRDDPGLIPCAVEEFLRCASPVTLQARNATRDVEIGGQRISQGDVVALSFPSANRDDRQFADGERCALDRHPNHHVAFGWGPHVCAGARIARLEMTVALEELVARVRDLRLASGTTPSWNHTGSVRGLATLPAECSGASG